MLAKNKTSRSGFTLAELLAAMMVFSIIMLAAANLVNQASNSFELGLSQVDTQDVARVLNQDFFRSLTGAVTADTFPFIVERGHSSLGGGASDSIFFLTTSPTKLHYTALQQNHYFAERNNNGIPRGTLYSKTQWPMLSSQYRGMNNIWNSLYSLTGNNAAVLADNVWSFKVNLYDPDGNIIGGASNYNSHNYDYRLPSRVEVIVEVLDEETWAKFNSPAFATLVANNKRVIRFTQTYSNKGAFDDGI